MRTSHDDVTALTVVAFAETVSGDSPAPGGGAVIGVVAGLAASLAAMAARFSLKRANDPAASEAILRRADELRALCNELANADTQAYTALAAAQRISTADGGDERRQAMETARDAAAAPPAQLASAAREIADIGLQLIRAGNPHLRTDVCTAALLASAAATSAAVLVKANVATDSSDDRLAVAQKNADAAAQAARRAAEALGLSDQAVVR